MAVISGTLGRFYSHGTTSTAFTYEACAVLSGDNYQISDTSKRWWPIDSPVTVYTVDASSTTEAAAALYTIRELGGVIEFAATPAGTPQVSGTFYPMLQVGGFHQWELNFTRPTEDTMRQGAMWESGHPGVANWKVSADGYWLDNYFFGTVDGDVPWIVVAYADYDTGTRYEAATYLTSHNVAVPNKSMTTESVEFLCSGQPRFYSS